MLLCLGVLNAALLIPPLSVAETRSTLSGKLLFPRKRPQQPIVVYLESEASIAKTPFQEAVTVRQRGTRFDPAFLVIVAGQRVRFLNDEDREIDHNIYMRGGANFDLGTIPPNGSAERAFNTPGEVLLHCSIHKYMDGRIFVAPSSAFAVLPANEDSFTIQDVPPGKYWLKTYQRAKRFPDLIREIEVRPKESLHLELQFE